MAKAWHTELMYYIGHIIASYCFQCLKVLDEIHITCNMGACDLPDMYALGTGT